MIGTVEGVFAGLVAAGVASMLLTLAFHVGRRDAASDFIAYCYKPKVLDERCLAAMGYEMKEKP